METSVNVRVSEKDLSGKRSVNDAEGSKQNNEGVEIALILEENLEISPGASLEGDLEEDLGENLEKNLGEGLEEDLGESLEEDLGVDQEEVLGIDLEEDLEEDPEVALEIDLEEDQEVSLEKDRREDIVEGPKGGLEKDLEGDLERSQEENPESSQKGYLSVSVYIHYFTPGSLRTKTTIFRIYLKDKLEDVIKTAMIEMLAGNTRRWLQKGELPYPGYCRAPGSTICLPLLCNCKKLTEIWKKRKTNGENSTI